jgi:hypothetical protein
MSANEREQRPNGGHTSVTGSRQNDRANEGQTKAKYGRAHTAYAQPNRCQHHLLRYRLTQPQNWPNDQPAAPARVDKEEGVKRGERGEQVAGRMWGEGGKSPPWTNKDTPQCYPITSHYAQCTSLDVHVTFVRCEGFQTRGYQWYHGFRPNPQLFGYGVYPYPQWVRCVRVRVRVGIFRPAGYL